MKMFCLALLAVTTACASATTSSTDLAPRALNASVVVDNQNFSDAAVYLIRDTQAIRLGTVTGLTTATLRLPAALVDTEISFQSRFIGSGALGFSPSIIYRPGERLSLSVPPRGGQLILTP